MRLDARSGVNCSGDISFEARGGVFSELRWFVRSRGCVRSSH